MTTRFLRYNPDQAYLLPPDVRDVLGEDHLVFFVYRVVERLDLSEFIQAYGEEGGAVYAPELMLKVWWYAYALGVSSARRLEQRIREGLAFRYLAGGATPDHWALSAFRRRHSRGINDVFTQVLEVAQRVGMIRLGHVAIDSTRVRGAVSRDRIDTEMRLRWVAQRVTPHASDNASLLPLLDQASRNCWGKPQRVSADTGFFSLRNVRGLQERGIDGYVPDANLSYELKGKGRARGIGRSRRLRDREHRRMRQKLQDPAGRRIYGQRQAIVEPVFGVLKQQRGRRQFRLRSLQRVSIEFTLAAIAYNLSRLFHRKN